MDIESIIQSFEEKINIIKLKKIDVIFTKLNPDQNDIIYLSDINDRVKDFMSEEAENLLKFFNTFQKQTTKDFMSRKYFYMNMMAAAQQNKFNINKILYDEDISEIQKSLQNIRKKNRSEIKQTNQINISSNSQQMLPPKSLGAKQNQKQEKINLISSNKSENQLNCQLQSNNIQKGIFAQQQEQSSKQRSSSVILQVCSVLSSPPCSNSQKDNDSKILNQNQEYQNGVSASNSVNNTSLNSAYTNISSAQTTSISYIKNEDNQIVPHVEVILKNAISTPMLPDQGVKDQYMTSSESSAQKSNYQIKEHLSVSKMNTAFDNNSFIKNSNQINNSFCNNNSIYVSNSKNTNSSICQFDAQQICLNDQENQKSLLNKRQDMRFLKNKIKGKENNNFNRSNSSIQKKTNHLIHSIDNHKQNQSQQQNLSQQSSQNDSQILRENTNINNIQQNNYVQHRYLYHSNNYEDKKVQIQESLYEQILKQKKVEPIINKNQIPPHPQSQSNHTPSIHQDKLIKIISRDKIIKDFKENFKGKENFCDDFMELDSTIRRLEKTNLSPVNTQIHKTMINDITMNYDSQNQNKYHSNGQVNVNLSNFQLQSNQNQINLNQIDQKRQSKQGNLFFSQNQNNNDLITNKNININDQKNYAPKVLKSVSRSNSNVEINKKVSQQQVINDQQTLNMKQNQQELSSQKSRQKKKWDSNFLSISKSSQKEKNYNSVRNSFDNNIRNSFESNGRNLTQNNGRRVVRSISSNLNTKSRNPSTSPQQNNGQQKDISRNVSAEQISNNLIEKSNNKREQQIQEKTPIKFHEFKQKQYQSINNKVQQKEIKKENSLDRLSRPKDSLQYTPLKQLINKVREQNTNSQNNIQKYTPNQQTQSEKNQILRNKSSTPKPKDYPSKSNSIERVSLYKKPMGYQDQFNKKKQQQSKSSRNQSVSYGQGVSQENSFCGHKKEIEENISIQGIQAKIDNFLQIDENIPELLQQDNIMNAHQEISHKKNKNNIQIPLSQSPNYQQYFEKIIMQDERISKYFTTLNDEEGLMSQNQLQNQNGSKKNSQMSNSNQDTTTVREQKFEALEEQSIEPSQDKKFASSQRNNQNNHESIFQMMMQDISKSPHNEQLIENQNKYNSNTFNQQQYAPQFGGFNSSKPQLDILHADHQNKLNKSYLDSPQQFLDVLKTKIEEDENNEFFLMQMENLKKIQQEKQKLMEEEAEMLQQLQRSQATKSSQKNLFNSIQSNLVNSKQQQGFGCQQNQEKITTGLPIPSNSLKPTFLQNQKQQQHSSQQQQSRNSYYSSYNRSSSQQQLGQNSTNSQSIEKQAKQSLLSNLIDNQEINYKDIQSIQQQSNYNSSSSQRDNSGSVDSGYNYTSYAAQKYQSNQILNNQQLQQNLPYNSEQQICFKQGYQSQQNINNKQNQQNQINHNSSLNFSFTDS